ncbi:MAG: complex I NDUFA9 subunit family protein, partial [Gammaproteobacteria bacterium]
LEWIPGKPMSLDNYRSLQVPSVCQGEIGLAALGIEPVAIEAVVPAYLQRQHQRARYRVLRTFARRR